MMNNTTLQLENYHDKIKQETMEIILDEILNIEVFLFIIFLYFIYISVRILFCQTKIINLVN